MLVVFEGIDGSGKTTVSSRVVESLRSRGLSVKHLRPGGKFMSPVIEAMRSLGREACHLDLTPESEFLLYLARDAQLLGETLRPALRQHDVVIADRCFYTAEVLGRYGRHLSADYTTPILQAVVGGLVPDIVVYVDVHPALARARRKAHRLATGDTRPPSRKGLTGVGLQYRLRAGYLEIARARPEQWVVVDNDNALESTVASITELVTDAHREGAPAAIRQFYARSTPASSSPPLGSVLEAFDRFLRWIDRRSVREPAVAAYLLRGLVGPGVDERRHSLAGRAPQGVLAGLVGRADAASWELRDRLCREYPGLVALSLRTLPNELPRAFGLRRELETSVPADVVRSLSGLDDESAWDFRERLVDPEPNAVAASLASLGSERAWELRERWLACRQDRLGEDYELACVAAQSVTELDDDRAWPMRTESHRAAPVAALASTAGLVDRRSFAWRQQYLSRATKVVMLTLRNVSHPQAWQMRRLVATDCKEAIDSIAGLDDPEAWELRDACRDLWPSTVVKSLGILADGARGQQLLERQLSVHPDNISLLKHASAIALGLHRLPSPAE